MEYRDGQGIYDRLQPALAKGEMVTLVFSGSEIFASPFFNAAVGQLLKDYQPDNLNRLVRFENLNARGQAILRRVIANAKDYYGDRERRRAMDAALGDEPEDEAGE